MRIEGRDTCASPLLYRSGALRWARWNRSALCLKLEDPWCLRISPCFNGAVMVGEPNSANISQRWIYGRRVVATRN